MAGFDFKIKTKMKYKKSQITMLMIIGLVIFIVVSLVLYLSKSAIKKQSQQSIKNVQETALDPQPIKEFVSKCLDKLAKDAIVLLGKQGGYIYKSQGGTIVDYLATDEGIFFVNYDNVRVSYNLLLPKFPVPPYSATPPAYPWPTFPYLTENSNEEIFRGFFGINAMPPLESNEGPNSMQTQIEAFIDTNIANCIDFNIFRSQGYEIEINGSKTQVVIGKSDIKAKSNMPLKIINTATKETFEIREFSTTVNIEMRDTYTFAKNLIHNDITNITFNISKSIVIENIYLNDDLIVITDAKLLVYGKPLKYIFARKNRAPALYYLKNNVLQFPQGYVINQTDLLQNQELKAKDPDEDSYAFSIYIGEFGNALAQFPKKLDVDQIKFRVEVSDGKLSDYQIITVNRVG